MDDSKGKIAVAALALLLLLILLPLFILTSAAEDEHNRTAALAGCALPSGETMVVPPEYEDAINAAAQTANFPPGVIAAQLFTESRFDPNAYQPSSGASGIAQFIRSTWETWGNGADPFDALAGIDAQGRYMAQLQRDVAPLVTSDRSRIELALAAYNAGPAAVTAAGGIPAIPETQNYVSQIMQLAQAATTGCQIPGGDVIGEIGSGKWVNPLPNSYITSTFGYRGCVPGVGCEGFIADHNGLDFATSSRAGTVVAATDLTITTVDNTDAAGAPVSGHAPDNPSVEFRYVHCALNSHRVRVGQTVAAGTPLCTEGATGYVTGPHLHFMILMNGTPVDPEPVLIANGVQLRYLP
ncbi:MULTISPECIES: peptidoglycan DD-metalloendopeptidase family protein [Micrococcus]|uniref:Putative peptidase n=1 Tax=Micrococcus sp. 28 TaxID=161213 RepID=Q8VPM3_9MICC|nr:MULTISPECIES: peptidoglycan DD-metalloendopeptidase family protein [Micrococcus]OFT08390.1 hypothetical protein HMPREF3102_09650 [Micrococcus sp. HMSC30C05]AAK62524.1 putative peptidase [Micrococcus sp. 28]MCD0180163.1 peptidoglycan DD-metalloendopeptidase family protein [Micrococcus luteus]MCM3481411.1 peptidoglycan DD-metalloendopeptidase family protein [Micrococcus luteus]MCV7449650.1 peptidoglycan DD-metalloendopeptidase family protein [Micrococcus luteus]